MSQYSIERVGRMWCETQQILNRYIELLIKHNRLAKKSVLADIVGMTYNELVNTVCTNPRTPLERGKMIAIEAEIYKEDAELFEQYLQELHCNDNIRLAGK